MSFFIDFSLALFAAGYTRGILLGLHDRRFMVDNDLVFGASGCCVRGARSSPQRRSGRRRIISTDRSMPQALGRTPFVLHLERRTACYPHGSYCHGCVRVHVPKQNVSNTINNFQPNRYLVSRYLRALGSENFTLIDALPKITGRCGRGNWGLLFNWYQY